MKRKGLSTMAFSPSQPDFRTKRFNFRETGSWNKKAKKNRGGESEQKKFLQQTLTGTRVEAGTFEK